MQTLHGQGPWSMPSPLGEYHHVHSVHARTSLVVANAAAAAVAAVNAAVCCAGAVYLCSCWRTLAVHELNCSSRASSLWR